MRSSVQSSPPRPIALLMLAMAASVLVSAGCGGIPRARAVAPRPGPIRSTPPRVDDGPSGDATARTLLDLHNRQRSDRDLPPLSLSPELTEAARDHVSGMIEAGEIGHEGADGSMPADRVKSAGYRFVNVGENVAAGQESAEEVMDGWMDSPGHRRNILGDFEQLGAARSEDADGRPFWCVVFATPLPRLDPAEAAAGLLERINDRRSEEGLAALAVDEPLAGVARDHARAMAGARSLDPSGFSAVEAIDAAGIGYRRLALNVSTGHPGPAEVLGSIASDPRSRRDLLGDFDRIGIGYATDAEGRPYWSVLYLRRADPSVGGPS